VVEPQLGARERRSNRLEDLLLRMSETTFVATGIADRNNDLAEVVAKRAQAPEEREVDGDVLPETLQLRAGEFAVRKRVSQTSASSGIVLTRAE
jgi:hypothetical protein